MKKIHVTISRAHKIAERMGALIGAAQAEMGLGRAAGFDIKPTQEQREAIATGVQSSLEAMRELERLIDLQATLRNSIAVANAQYGITPILGLVERNKRIIKHLADMLSAVTPSAGAVHVSAVDEIEWPEKSQNRYGSSAVSITGFDAATIDVIKATKTKYEKELYALQDELADKNATKIEINLPSDVAEALGL